ncbi:MAG: hypothetical protein PHE27_02800, partial [Alphaproteobacteria bacterium]|nr:hypothetical protein [Alphaproteobacteria bacterium]
MKKKQTANAKIAQAALKLAAKKGWPEVTLTAVAKEAKMPAAALKKICARPTDLIPLIGEEITRESIAKAGKVSACVHDALFDLLMARFDILQTFREGIVSIAEAAPHDKELARSLAHTVMKAMDATVDAACPGARMPLPLSLGLSAVYGFAFVSWCRDKTPD